jgi:hypothetical protein
MKYKKFIKLLTIISIFTFILITHTVYASGLAVSPAIYNFGKMLKEVEAEGVIQVFNMGVDVEHVNVTAIGGDLEDWFTFENIPLKIEPKEYGELRFRIRPPAEATNREYDGWFHLEPQDRTENVTGSTVMAVKAGVSVRVLVEVTGEEIYGFRLQTANINTIETERPLILNLGYQNTGNVIVNPRAELTIYNRDKTETLIQETITERLIPREIKNIKHTIDSSNLEIGQYWATISIYNDQNQKINELEKTFDIKEKGSLTQNIELQRFKNDNKYELGDVVRVGIILKNIGEVSTNVVFKGELYLNNKLIRPVDPESYLIDIGEEIEIPVFFEQDKLGRYELKGYGLYGGKITDTKSTIFNIIAPEIIEQKQPINKTTYITITIIIIIILLLLFIIFKPKKRKQHNKNSNIDSALEKARRLNQKLKNR